MKNARIMKSAPRCGLAAALLAAGLLATFAAEAPSVALRGFGTVRDGGVQQEGGVSVRQFTCENADRAKVLLHKMGRDLAQSATEPVEWKRVTLGGTAVPVLTRPGLGSFLLVARGDTVTVYGAGDLKKPGLALFWSGRNSELLPRPVPFCFDLGRGDLQALGYSYGHHAVGQVRSAQPSHVDHQGGDPKMAAGRTHRPLYQTAKDHNPRG